MSRSELNQSGLFETDVLRSEKPGDFDHLPLVADFVFVTERSSPLKKTPKTDE